MILRRTIIFLIALYGLSACGTPTPSAAPPPTPTTLAGRLTFAGSTTVQPLIEDMREGYAALYPGVQLEIAAGGSVVGINAVREGSADVGMSSRNLKPEEQSESIEIHQIAIDVLAIIVHPSNPVTDLSLSELQGIFTGKISNWKSVGGPDLAIVPVIREVSSGTRGAFDEIALQGAEPVASANVQVTAGEVEAQVAENPAAIGYVGFGNLGSDIHVVTIDGFAPSPETARNGTYRLQRPLLLLLGPLSRPLARTFIEFALSPVGQQIVTADGWVPVGP